MPLLNLARRLAAFAFLMTLSWSAHAQFIAIFKTDNPGISGSNQFYINRGNSTSFNIHYEDINNSFNSGNINAITGIAPTITLPSAGTYRITFNTSFNSIIMGGNPDSGKLLSVESWGLVAWISMADAFAGCENLVINAPDNPNLTVATSLHQAFQACPLINSGFKNWGVSHITDFSEVFSACPSFNDDISGWNVSNATDLTGMFAGATSFNQDISGWDISNVTTLQGTFRLASVFNQNINSWNTSNVTNMIGTFSETENFNQPLDHWNLSNVTDVDQMFSNATAFDQDIGGWDVSSVNNFSDMFSGASAFNHDIGGWSMANCVYAAGMFENAVSFNQDISSWNMSNNTDLSRMFNGAGSFDQNIGEWNVSSTTAMYATFQNATIFNQDISSWNTGNCTYMGNMFTGASSFNNNISNWNTTTVNNMTAMFQDAASFNQDLSTWDVRQVTDMTDMFSGSHLSNANYDKILIGWSGLTSLSSDVTLGAPDNYYCTSAPQRQSIIDNYNWTIVDNGQGCPPTITSFSPMLAGEGDMITISGTNLNGTAGVSFGGVDADSFNQESPSSITAIVGPGASGSVSVITSFGGASLPGFIFIPPTPNISSFSPMSAGTGQTVTITGTDLTGATDVSFGDTPATSFTVVSSTTITAIVADGTTGDVAVTTPGGTSTLAGFVFSIPTSVIVIKDGDNNTGNEIDQSAFIGTTIADEPLTKTFSIANIGTSTAQVTSVTSTSSYFEITEQPTSIAAGSFGRLTISMSSSIPGDYSSDITVITTNSTIHFQVSGTVENSDIIIYNAVTPNGDAMHEFFHIKNIEHYPGNRVVILDRLGNEVFKINDYDNSADSKRFNGVNSNNGKSLTDGTYYYVIDTKAKKYTGFLLLQR